MTYCSFVNLMRVLKENGATVIGNAPNCQLAPTYNAYLREFHEVKLVKQGFALRLVDTAFK